MKAALKEVFVLFVFVVAITAAWGGLIIVFGGPQ